MHVPHDLEECFKQGMRAREAGTARPDNPYVVGTAEHGEWAAGWSATLDLDEDDDPESTRVKSGATDTGAAWDAEETLPEDPISGPSRRR